jgi:hypothetical protein
MKLLLTIILVFGSLIAQAQDSVVNECTSNLLNLKDWSKISSPILSCLNSNSDFSSGVSALCLEDRNQLSIQFQEYLNYQQKYQDALADLQAMPNPTAVARNRVAQAKMDWEVLGNRTAIGRIISKVRTAYSSCSIN